MITLNELSNLSKSCTCGNRHYEITIEDINISYNALNEAVTYIKNKEFQKVAIVADQITFQVAGEKLASLLVEGKVNSEVVIIQPNELDDVIADEISLIEAMLGISQDTNVVIAVGTGTIHDIARFASFKMGKPFISVPTAPSVDGFNSMGAPVVIKGFKLTYQMHSPIAIFADLSILQEAPKELIAAGFGDMIGKYTSLADWKFSHLIGGESYCPLSARLTYEALDDCVKYVDQISDADEEGIKILIQALIQSGLAMLLVGHSSPASGGEHHLSHYWEMEFLKQGRAQVLHGAKVAVSAQLILEVYKNKVLTLISNKHRLENLDAKNKDMLHKVIEKQTEVEAIIHSLPDPESLSLLVQKVGGAGSPGELGIHTELVQNSLLEGHTLRNRYTMLKFWNEHVGTHHYA
ncbi:sn-glycerol-1-phosphate dehydrogenase [Metabacillus sediminilitoris]|uniref:sn-glycerol-1-phosphate dehydrogenase n=1 Tax=Metabacillus sediminilitoris TaxID=2567941 RepID=A0A4S4BWJ2_9BACI|nr:sn-glycerol-1-phosphate dehydrogenase [Metabacillus sediminilitoris]QGQ46465.1 iron-containing alcohol dehydrogenase [Metabacillus sediminilitoris]THF77451.1 sn-glycerol-1-phosphate dehydrogenase [Metabacillus sediminilitoris]